jgi:hypothetical protein
MTDKLFFDTDCISSFLWVKEENLLLKLYPGIVVLPKQVEGRTQGQEQCLMGNRTQGQEQCLMGMRRVLNGRKKL